MDKENLNAANDIIEINLVEIYYLFLQKLKMIVLMAVIGGLLAGSYTYFFIAPKYKATAKLYVVSASNDSVVNLSDLQIGTSLTADYKELVLSRPMLESVLRSLKLNMSAGQLLDMLDVTNASGTRILSITATSTDPQQAMDIANKMATLAVSWLPNVMESTEPNIVEDAILPTARSSPSYSRNVLIGGFVLALLYFGLCVVHFIQNDTITTPEQMERYFGALPLASIPEDESLKTSKKSTNPNRRSGRRVLFGGKKRSDTALPGRKKRK